MQYPNIIKIVGGYLNIFNIDLFDLFYMGCKAARFDQFNNLLLASLWPIFVLASFGATAKVLPLLARREIMGTLESAQKWVARLKLLAMILLFLVLPGVSREIVRSLLCDSFDDGSRHLRADYRINCDSDRYKVMVAYCAAMFLLYPLGIPSLMFYLLFKNRRSAYPANNSRILKVVPCLANNKVFVLVREALSAADDEDLCRKVPAFMPCAQRLVVVAHCGCAVACGGPKVRHGAWVAMCLWSQVEMCAIELYKHWAVQDARHARAARTEKVQPADAEPSLPPKAQPVCVYVWLPHNHWLGSFATALRADGFCTCVAWRGVAWRGVAWRGVAWRGVAWRGIAERGIEERGGGRGVVWCGLA